MTLDDNNRHYEKDNKGFDDIEDDDDEEEEEEEDNDDDGDGETETYV